MLEVLDELPDVLLLPAVTASAALDARLRSTHRHCQQPRVSWV